MKACPVARQGPAGCTWEGRPTWHQLPTRLDAAQVEDKRNLRKVVAASFVGTTIEWYDFFLYGTAAALVFGDLFFPGSSPLIGTLSAFGTFAVGFAARPLGGVVFGHFGDRVGRKAMLVTSLLIMGLATFLIGCLPTHASIGVAAPILLVVLRFAQGIGVGGEWGGAVLMSVEHAPKGKRGFYGAFPQMGVPAGLLLSTVAFLTVQNATTEDQFMAWGWRIPFLISIVLVIVGLFIRMAVMESPAFKAVKESGTESEKPLVELIRDHKRDVLTAMGMRIAENGTFYIFTVFVLAYGEDTLKLSKNTMLTGVIIAAAVGLFSVPFWGALSDRVGRRKLYHGGRRVHAPVRVSVLRAAGHEGAGAHLARDRARRQRRPRPDVRAAGGVLLRAVRDADALHGRVDRLPARVGVRRRLRAADRGGPARGGRRRAVSCRALHGGHGRDHGRRDALRTRDVPLRPRGRRGGAQADRALRAQAGRVREREPAGVA